MKMKNFAIIVGIVTLGALGGVIATDKIGAELTGEKWEQKVEAQGGEVLMPEADETYKATIDFQLSQMDEWDVIQFMHKMSHQKIKANDKWGAERMDKETIEAVMKAVGSSDFTHKITLMTTLERWENGDFSIADLDHNNLWEMQGGTIGEATGILTPAEEQKWIDKNF